MQLRLVYAAAVSHTGALDLKKIAHESENVLSDARYFALSLEVARKYATIYPVVGIFKLF